MIINLGQEANLKWVRHTKTHKQTELRNIMRLLSRAQIPNACFAAATKRTETATAMPHKHTKRAAKTHFNGKKEEIG